jgi:hypothetical protein
MAVKSADFSGNFLTYNNPKGNGYLSMNQLDEYSVGNYSTTFGSENASIGIFSTSFGTGNISYGDYTTVCGAYSLLDTNGLFLNIIGNGISESKRNNAYSIDFGGNSKYSGDVIAYSNGIERTAYCKVSNEYLIY